MKRILFLASGLLCIAGLNSQVLSDSVTTADVSRDATRELVGFSMDGMGHVEFNGFKTFYGSNTFDGSTSFTSTVGFRMMPQVTGGYRFTGADRQMLYVGDYRFLPQDNWLYLAPSNFNSGLKMNPGGKIRIMSYDGIGETDLFNDDIRYDLYPPNQSVPAWYKDAALTVRTNGSRSLHSVVTQAGGIEAIRSDVFSSETKHYTAYRVYSNAYSSLVFSVNGDGSVYSAGGMLQLSAPAVSGRSVVENPDRKISSLSRISELNSITYNSQEVANVDEAVQNGNTRNAPASEKSCQRIGLMAEEVESVIPEAVRTLSDGRKGIWYSDVVSVMVDALKELNGKVDSLQMRIAELEEPGAVQSRSASPSPKSNDSNDRMAMTGAELYQNAPNPFNVNTDIRFRLPETYNKALICIYNLQGSQLSQYDVSNSFSGGVITLQASSFAPGMYLYVLVVDGKEIDCKRMTITN